jgi:tRNA nucleotidyltransferase (CCA-adding enzyme)
MFEALLAPLRGVFAAIALAGGRPYVVGGAVRDALLGISGASPDIDVEVYGLAPAHLDAILAPFGDIDRIGASFGVTTLDLPGFGHIDFAIPRREISTGEGHRAFSVELDPHSTLEGALARRDFTINAMMVSRDGILVDPYGGLRDLRAGVLRHVSPAFSEDPLRVLRGMRFAGRFGFAMHPETARLASGLSPRALARERVWTEWAKLARSPHPSRGLGVLAETGWLRFYPELAGLVGCEQDPTWHPEGDVWQHTLHVADAAAVIARRDGVDPLLLVLAAIGHDLGKPTTTVVGPDGRVRAPGHPEAGVAPTRSFLAAIGAPAALTDGVVTLVREHMAHVNGMTPRSVRRLSVRLGSLTLADWARVVEADHSGRPPLPPELPAEAAAALAIAAAEGVTAAPPARLVTGHILAELARDGVIPAEFGTPGPHVGRVIRAAWEAQLDGDITDPAEWVREWVAHQ